MLSDTMMLGGGRKAAYSIENSLLFRKAPYLKRTPTVSGNNKLFTVSLWFRRGSMPLTSGSRLFSTYRDSRQAASYGAIFAIGLDANDYLGVYCHGWGDNPPIYFNYNTSRRFSDPNAWYHLVVAVDIVNPVATDRVRIYINGVRETSFQSGGTISNGTHDIDVNKVGIPHFIGRYWDQGWVDQASIDASGLYYDGQLADFHLIDGAAMGPGTFGELDPATRSWRPKPVQNGAFGTNGFYLGQPWNSASLGTDYSGKGNHWTPSGFVASDVLKDSPTNVYATLNPLIGGGVTLTNGNLSASCSNPSLNGTGTLFVSSGKWYWEVEVAAAAEGPYIGASNGTKTYFYRGSTGQKYDTGGHSSYGASYTTNDVIGVKLDMDAGSIEFLKNNVSQGVAFTGLVGSWGPVISKDGTVATLMLNLNFGQRPFTYTPPSGFKALCTANLPTPVSAAAKQPGEYYSCQVVTHDGTSTAFTLGWDALAADWLVRIKSQGSGDWYYIDTKRGLDKVLVGNSTQAEIANAAMVTNRTASGFVLGSGLAAGTYLVEAWRVAPEAGFDIVPYTASGTSSVINHNNGSIPAMVVVKNRGAVTDWPVAHRSLPSDRYVLVLNSTSAQVDSGSGYMGRTATQISFPQSTVNTNTSGQRYVAYVWSEVPGFSAFGAYTGNGSADGSFIHLGFTAGDFSTKRTDAAGSWYCDTVNQNNPAYPMVLEVPNGRPAGGAVDICASGVKLRNADSSQNTGTMIYAAWAAHPLGAKRVTPATAR